MNQAVLLLIFPTENQLDYIQSLNEYGSNIYVISKNSNYGNVNQNNNKITIFQESDNIDTISNLNVYALCCNEEALYWARKRGDSKWIYPFSSEIFELLTKYSMKKFLTKKYIRVAQYSKNQTFFKEYPIIAKPTIGFASIGVKFIKNRCDLMKYLQDYKKSIQTSNIAKYKDMYFPDEDNFCFFEEYIEGKFYRTPFIVIDNEAKYIFPIQGKKITSQPNSDFHWTEFEYGKNEMSAVAKIEPVLHRLISIFQLKNGVFVAEFLITDSGEVVLLELSPRQTSSRIAKMIYYSTGLDLEKTAIDIFLGRQDVVIETSINVKLSILTNNKRFNPPANYSLVDTWEDSNLYGEYTKSFFMKRECGCE